MDYSAYIVNFSEVKMLPIFMSRAVICMLLAGFAVALAGCNEDRAASSAKPNGSDQAAIDKGNAEIARKNTVSNQIK